MASGHDHLSDIVESDDASLIYRYKEETGNPERYIACDKKEYFIQNPPQIPVTNSTLNSSNGQTSIDYYQCSKNPNEVGYDSDSAKEEDSPYGSPDNPKNDMMVASGKPGLNISRKQRTPSEITEQPLQQETFVSANIDIEQQPSGEYGQEMTSNRGVSEALALSGSFTETKPSTPTSDLNERPRGGKNDRLFDQKYEDINIRLASFLSKEWPHKIPSAEKMAAAGLIFKGEYSDRGRKYYDMVECYKCKGTLCGFKQEDDPVKEHRRLYPNCK